MLRFIVANFLTQLLFRQQALVLYSAGQQAADIYSASIFKVALIYGTTTSTFVFQFCCSEVVTNSKLFTCDGTQLSNFLRTHIAIQQLLGFDTSHVLFIQVAYNKCICVMSADWTRVLIFTLLSSVVRARRYKLSN